MNSKHNAEERSIEEGDESRMLIFALAAPPHSVSADLIAGRS